MKAVQIKSHFVIFFCLLSLMVHSQQLATDFHGIKALRKAYTYTNIKGIQACFGNPAGLTFTDRYVFNTSAENRFGLPELIAFQLAAAGPHDRYGHIGLVVSQFGNKHYVNMQSSLVFGRQLFKKLSVGIKFDWLNTRIEGHGKQNHFSFEVGLISNITKELSVGIHVFSPYGMNFTDNRKIPTIMTIGLQYAISKLVQINFEIEKNTFHGARIKSSIDYKIKDYFHCSFGIFTESKASNLACGVELIILKNSVLDLGITYNQLLGISSGIGFEFKF